jgi:uncharacterized protein with PIN domain
MRLFYDTSAVVPLLLKETHSELSGTLWDESDEAWCWRWLTLETEAALTRQRADVDAWRNWRSLEPQFSITDFDTDQSAALRAFNRSIGLRAMDAAHLFVFDRLLSSLSDLLLVSFDREMIRAAHALGLPVYPDLP